MLRFFKINDPYRLLGILAVLVLLSLPFFIDPPSLTVPQLKGLVLGEAIAQGKIMYLQILDFTAPMAAGFFGLMNWIFGRSTLSRQIITLLIIFFQASFFAILLITNKAYNDSSYVPALIFAVLCFFSFDLFSFSPELLASTLLLLVLNYLFKEVEFRSQRDEVILNLGISLGAATLLVFSYIIFLFGTFAILFIFTRPSIRKCLLLTFGFALPHLLLIVIYYFWGETGALWSGFYEPSLRIHEIVLISSKSIFVLAAVPLCYFVFSLFMLNREARFTKYQSQLFQVMFFWLILCFIQILVTRELTPHSFIIFIPSLAYFISHYLLLIRRRWIAEAMFWIFLISISGMNLMARYHYIDAVSYEKLMSQKSPFEKVITNEKVMVIADDAGLYKQNRLGGYFLDWDLSRNVLEHPDYYENVMLVEQSFKSDPPDVIVDPDDKMKIFFQRIPALKPQYQRDGNLYRRHTIKPGISNN